MSGCCCTTDGPTGQATEGSWFCFSISVMFTFPSSFSFFIGLLLFGFGTAIPGTADSALFSMFLFVAGLHTTCKGGVCPAASNAALCALVILFGCAFSLLEREWSLL